MDRIYVFILRNDVWILIVAALGLIWYISEFIRSRRLLQRARFGLERERGVQVRNNAAIFILALTLVIATILYVNYQVAPTLPAELLKPPTPTPDALQTPLASPTPLAPRPPTATPPLAPTITLPGQPVAPSLNLSGDNAGDPPSVEVIGAEAGTATPLPTRALPPTPIVGCTLQLTLNQPRNGAVITGFVEFFGTVNTPDFRGYTLQANGPQTNGQWASLLGRTIEQTVSDGPLGTVNLSQWESGPYLIRLTALDSNENEAYQCVIQITLDN